MNVLICTGFVCNNTVDIQVTNDWKIQKSLSRLDVWNIRYPFLIRTIRIEHPDASLFYCPFLLDLFTLRYPMNYATLICGGILTSICIRSGHASGSKISIHFCAHNFLMISPTSFLFPIYFFPSELWCKNHMVLTSIFWACWIFYFVLCFFIYIHIINLQFSCNALLHIHSNWRFLLCLYLRLALSSPFFLLLRSFFHPGRTGGLSPRINTPIKRKKAAVLQPFFQVKRI